MRLDSLTLKGITVYEEPQTVDFSSLPEGLIAIVGPNGGGKTTLLESVAAALYRELPSRPAGLIRYAHGRDAHIYLAFRLNGARFESRLLIDAERTKMEAYLHRNGEPVEGANGKVTQFDQAVAKHVASKRLMLSSVFAAQNRAGSFLDMKPGSRTELMIELLGLEHLPLKEQAAKEKAEAALVECKAADESIARLADDLRALEAAEARLKSLTEEYAAARILVDAAEVERRRLSESDVAAVAAANQAKARRDAELAAIADQETQTERDLNALRVQIEERVKAIEAAHRKAREEAEGFKREVEEIARRIANNRTILERREEIEAAVRDLPALESRIAELEPALEAARRTAEDRRLKSAARDSERRELSHVEQSRREAEKVAAERPQVEAATGAMQAAQARITAITAEMEQLRADLEARSRLEERLRAEDRELHILAEKLSVMERNALELDAVPCGGRAPYDACAKIVRAVEEAKSIPQVKNLLAHGERAAADLRETLTHMVVPDGLKSKLRTEMDEQERALESARLVVARTPIVKDAESRLLDYAEREAALKRKVAQIEEELAAMPAPDVSSLSSELMKAKAEFGVAHSKARHLDALQNATQRIEELTARWNELSQRIQAAAQPPGADPMLVGLEEQEASMVARVRQLVMRRREIQDSGEVSKFVAAAQRAQQALAGQFEALNRANAEYSRSAAEIAACQSEIDRLLEVSKRLDEIAQRRAVAAQLHSDWSLIQKAFGKKGIAKLEIDAAGPAISALINDLLYSCFSSRFSARLLTQRETADGRLIEDFDIEITDAVNGWTGTIDDLSGGQKVVVSEAIGQAIAIYNKGGSPLETLFRDETTGALDPETAPLYIQMLRKAMQLGGFHRVIYVTHNPDCASMADAVIECAEGKVSVRAA